MTRTSPLQDRYPNQHSIYIELRKLSGADLDALVQHYQHQAELHRAHAQALIAYRERVVDMSRHGR